MRGNADVDFEISVEDMVALKTVAPITDQQGENHRAREFSL
tara:strand:+ start:231 stop:353 length:123 start_codon:yes stop_codon:yes gene_type:complete